jgi:hypothetical protein
MGADVRAALRRLVCRVHDHAPGPRVITGAQLDGMGFMGWEVRCRRCGRLLDQYVRFSP